MWYKIEIIYMKKWKKERKKKKKKKKFIRNVWNENHLCIV
jgi:hypothetical protein